MESEDRRVEPPVASVWTRQPRHQKEQLSRERIVAEAVQLLDAEGIEALSMRTLGQRLGAGATSLYRHVASKDELIELVVDEVYGEIDVPDLAEPGSWRLACTAIAHSMRWTGLRHRWLMSVLGQVGMTYIGPNVMSVTSRSLKIFTVAGFDAVEANQALSTLSAYVIGMTAAEAGWLSALARNGLDERDWMRILAPSMDQAAAEGFEDIEIYRSQLERDPREVRNEGFVYGLERVLDGLQVRLTAVLSGEAPARDGRS